MQLVVVHNHMCWLPENSQCHCQLASPCALCCCCCCCCCCCWWCWCGPAESELLGVTGPEWRDRASTLRLLELQPVIQYTAVCGLHPDLVTRLALVELEAAPTGAATPPITWRDWLREARRGRGIEVHRASGLPGADRAERRLPRPGHGWQAVEPCCQRPAPVWGQVRRAWGLKQRLQDRSCL
jgi:hypothetical protein